MSGRRLFLLAAFALTWTLAAVALFAGGVLYERASRYDHCSLVFVGHTLVHACPIAEFRERPPATPGAKA